MQTGLSVLKLLICVKFFIDCKYYSRLIDITNSMEKNKNIDLLDRFLKGETTETEDAMLFDWFGSKESQRDIYASYDERWENASDMIPSDVQDRIYKSIRNKTNLHQKIKTKRFTLRSLSRYIAVACLFIVIGMSLFIVMGKGLFTTNFVVSAEEGMKSTVELPDGTKVWLNSGSRLMYSNTYNFWNRKVHLEGEGYFEVNRNERKNFIVEVNGLEVEALGTKFNVKAYSGSNMITTTLLKGKVNVRSNEKEMLLSPDQQIQFNIRSKSFLEVKSCDASKYALWKNNELYFDCESLEEIGMTLEMLYSVDVVFASESAKKYTFCGAISNTNLINVLECITMTAPIHYEMKNNVLYFSDIEK